MSEPQRILSVLIVDDDSGFLELAKSMLDRLGGFELHVATSGEQALEMLAPHSFDAVVADYSMPGLNGLEFMRKAKSAIEVPFIILSGKGNEEVIIDALNSGAAFYIQKEGDPKLLFSNLASMIRQASDKWAAERALKESEERYRLFVEELPGLAFQGEMDFRAVSLHGELEEITGYSPEDFMLGGLTWDMLVHPDDRAGLEEQNARIASEPHAKGNRDYRIVRKDGSIRWINEIVASIAGEDGRPSRVQGIIFDITERKADERRIRDLATIVDFSHDAVYGVDHHGNIVSWNFGAERLYGYRSQEISGKPLSTLVPEDRQEELESIQRLLSDGEKVENYDTVHLSKDGSRIDVSLTVSRVAADPRGNLKWSFIGRDISERKKSERMLVDSELKYRTIFDGANDAMYIFDMSGGVLDGNAAACELLGYSRQELMGLGMKDIDWNAEEKSTQSLIDKIRRDRSAFFETVHYTKDKNEVPVEISARLIEYAHKPAILAIVRDISERKMTEEALMTVMTSLEELESIVSTSPAIVFQWTYTNDRFVQFVTDNVVQFGYHSSDLVSREQPYSRIIHPDDRARVASEIAKFAHDSVLEYNLEYRIVTRDEETRWVDDRTTVRIAETGLPMIQQGIVMDITARKNAEEALRLANEKLNLMGSITRHDVVNQLSIVLGALALAEDDVDEASRKAHLGMARDAIRIVSQQLEFAGSYQKAGSKPPEWVHVRLELASVLDSMDLKGISIEQHLGDLEIYADPMFGKVVFNLIDNSVRHGGEVSLMRIHARERSDSLVLTVEDNGSGIRPEDKELVFQKGYGQHTGLGLFLSREILAITGMKIEETGDFGSGTRFEVTVPAGKYRNCP